MAQRPQRVQRRGGVSFDQAFALQHHAETLVITHKEPAYSEDVLRLAASSGCRTYDCEFVAAAQQLGVPLITADQALLTTFPDLAQPLPTTRLEAQRLPERRRAKVPQSCGEFNVAAVTVSEPS